MAQNNSVMLLDFALKEDITSFEVATLLSKLEYSDEIGIGFKNISLEDNEVIVGEALKRTPIFINLMNPISLEIEKKEEFVLSEIEFAIDLKHSIIEVYSNHREVKKLLLIFRSMTKDVILISQLNFSISQVMFALRTTAKNAEVRKMCIKDFQYEAGVIGTYDATFFDSEVAWTFLDKYKTGISSVTSSITNDDWEVALVIGANGQVKFNKSSKKSIFNCLELLKSLIIKLKYHA